MGVRPTTGYQSTRAPLVEVVIEVIAVGPSRFLGRMYQIKAQSSIQVSSVELAGHAVWVPENDLTSLEFKVSCLFCNV